MTSLAASLTESKGGVACAATRAPGGPAAAAHRRFLEVLGQVEEDLQTMIDHLDHDGPGYARRYLDFLHSSRGGSPRPPSGMHPLIAKAIREAVLENVDHIPPRLAGGR